MESLNERENYILTSCTPEDPLLAELKRQTYIRVLNPKMISGHYQGKFLEMISYMIRPAMALEIGTFTGYSAICMGRGLADGGILHTIDINDEIRDLASGYIGRAGLEKRIRMHTGDALKIIPALEGPFDLVFIDGEKSEYREYYNLVLTKVKKGGFILADNVLWDNKVWNPEYFDDQDTSHIRSFNEMICNDNRVENFLLPIRDGLMIVRKK